MSRRCLFGSGKVLADAPMPFKSSRTSSLESLDQLSDDALDFTADRAELVAEQELYEREVITKLISKLRHNLKLQHMEDEPLSSLYESAQKRKSYMFNIKYNTKHSASEDAEDFQSTNSTNSLTSELSEDIEDVSFTSDESQVEARIKKMKIQTPSQHKRKQFSLQSSSADVDSDSDFLESPAFKRTRRSFEETQQLETKKEESNVTIDQPATATISSENAKQETSNNNQTDLFKLHNFEMNLNLTNLINFDDILNDIKN